MINILKRNLRQLWRSPGFSIITIIMLALGVGLSTSAFSFANIALLRSLPLPNGDRLVRLFRTAPESSTLAHSPGNFFDLRDSAISFSQIFASYPDMYNLTIGDRPPEAIYGLNVTANFLATLGVQPLLGRNFAQDEDQPGKGAVIILSNSYWRQRFAADPNIIGSTVRINSEVFTVVGVLPPVLDITPVWGNLSFIKPLTLWGNMRGQREAKWFDLAARLKPGVTIAAAQTELTSLATRLAKDDPVNNGAQGIHLVPLASSNLSDSTRTIYWLITALAFLVLVIACANLAGLHFARAFSRSHDMAVRSALGASRGALIAPLLGESFLLSLCGGILGILISICTNHSIARAFDGPPIPLDMHVFCFSIAAVLLTGFIFGLSPAWLASRISTGDALKSSSRSASSGRDHKKLKFILIVCQLALAFVLVSAALSFGIALNFTLRRDVGWRKHNVLTGVVSLPYQHFKDAIAQREFTHIFQTRISQLPGISQVSISNWTPIFGYSSQEKLFIDGFDTVQPGHEPLAVTNGVDEHFFGLLHIALKDGRNFQTDVLPNSPPVIVINESMARNYWPSQSAVGKSVRFARGGPSIEIIGVVGDVKMAASFDQPISRFQIYRPLEQVPNNYYSFVIQSAVPSETLENSVRKAIAAVDVDIMVQQLGSVDQILHSFVASNNLLIFAISVFAATGLLISVLGLYSVMAQHVVQRKREIGIRIALGAEPQNIVCLVLSYGSQMIVSGLVVGFIGAIGVERFYRQTMPELPLPPFIWEFALAIILTLVGLLACFLPARRVSRINPAIVLHTE